MAQRLIRLRELLTAHKIGAYVLPRTDEHQSQYLTESDERVSYISGFTGSNAIALVSPIEASLWTDSRYYLQAQKQLEKQWQLRKMIPEQPKWFEHLVKKYPEKTKIGFDPTLLTAKNAIQRANFFKEKGFQFIPIHPNFVDQIWENRPKAVKPDIFLHEQWAGRSLKQKVTWVRQKIKEKKGRAAIFNDLSEIAWLLNLRSSQIPHNPFFKAILIITIEGGTLYLTKGHSSINNQNIKSHLQSQNIVLSGQYVQYLAETLINKNQLNFSIYNHLKDLKYIEWEGINLYRAIKTQKEIQGFKRCHLADGIAMSKFWAWRSQQKGKTEYQAAQKIDNLRKQQPHNCGISFDTISACGPNAAIVHYRPSPAHSSVLDNSMMHLLDSGGQYYDGTTDVTRVFHFGSPSAQQKEAYTRVLLGNLDIQRLQWPQGTLNGAQIDVLARRHLWKRRWDYQHGTGHGVGYFAAVHEPPVGISRLSEVKFKNGMIVTNEPGYYRQSCFGIRIQNMLLVREKDNYNYFQNLTLCPYDRNLIDKKLLNEDGISHINSYHQKVWRTISPHLQGDELAKSWLNEAVKPI